MKPVYLFAAAVLMLFGEAHAAGVLDQEQTEYDGGLSARTLPGYKVGQSFTAGLTGTLTEIDMGFFNNLNGDGELEIFSGAGFGGELLESETVSVISVTGTGVSWNDWQANVPVVSGSMYTFRFTPNAATLTDPYGVATGDQDSYTRGAFYYQDPGGTSIGTFQSVFRTYVTQAGPRPVIGGVLSETTTNGFGFNYQIQATNNPTGYNATGLPPGLVVTSSDGLISGTATVDGTTAVGLSASNSSGTGTNTLSIIVVSEPAPVISSGTSVTVQVGTLLDYQIQASNNPTAFDSTTLPPGLELDASTGLISGTPTMDGSYSATIDAINLGGTGSRTLAFTILPLPPTITSGLTASGNNGSAFTYQITASNDPTAFDATGLPPGLSVATDTGLITGTLAQGGVFPVRISAANISGSGTAIVSMSVFTNTRTLAGTYDGLGSIGGTNAALFTISIERGGAFTSTFINTGGKRLFRGNLDQYGTFAGRVGSFFIDLATDAAVPGITGAIVEVSGENITRYDIQASPQKIYASDAPGHGTYTVVIPAITGTDPTIPHAPGYGRMSVNSQGAISISGKLADGSDFSAHAQMHEDGTWTLFAPLYAGRNPGTLAGMMRFEVLIGSDCDGAVDWIKPAQTKIGPYSTGFGLRVNVLAAKYDSSRPVASGPGTITLSGGDLSSPITNNLSVSGNRITVTGTDKVVVSVTPATGAVSGSFLDPATGKKTPFAGEVYQKPVSTAFGLFLNSAESGGVEIDP